MQFDFKTAFDKAKVGTQIITTRGVTWTIFNFLNKIVRLIIYVLNSFSL